MNTALLTISQARLCYGAKTVLANVSLTVGERDVLILRGPNGGGKTTLLRLMAGLLQPGEGTVVRRDALRTGYLPQYRSIDRRFPITVGQVVLSGLAGSKPLWRGYNTAERQQAQAVMARLDLEHLAQRPIDALSGGQWQRTLLGRALVSNPDLLLLDEPDTHLDTDTKALLYDTLAEEARHRAIVVVSHDDTLPARFVDSRIVQVAHHAIQQAGG